MKKPLLRTAFGLLLLLTASPLRAEESLPRFTILTETWIPYQYEKKGRAEGIAVEVMLRLLKRVGSRQGRDDILFYPWTRGYRTALRQRNTILFLTTRTRERERLFRWVGPLFRNTTCLIAKKSRKLRLSSPTDLCRYTYGTVRDDVGEQLLLRAGVFLSRIIRNTSHYNTIKMLAAGRLDLVVQNFSGFTTGARALGLNPDDFACVYRLSSNAVGYAFNRETPDWIVARFQRAFTALEREGTLDAIFTNFGAARPLN